MQSVIISKIFLLHFHVAIYAQNKSTTFNRRSLHIEWFLLGLSGFFFLVPLVSFK